MRVLSRNCCVRNVYGTCTVIISRPGDGEVKCLVATSGPVEGSRPSDSGWEDKTVLVAPRHAVESRDAAAADQTE